MKLSNFEKEYFKQSTFYFARVEDAEDPNKMGRYRIRIYGIDSFNEEKDIKITQLPWARTINNFGLHREVGLMRQYRINDIVVCTLINGNRDTPLILGCIEAPEDYGEHDFKGIVIRNDEKITFESIEPLPEEKPGDDDKEKEEEEEEEEEDKKSSTREQTIETIINTVSEGGKKVSETEQTTQNIANRVMEKENADDEEAKKHTIIEQKLEDITLNVKDDKNESTLKKTKEDITLNVKDDSDESEVKQTKENFQITLKGGSEVTLNFKNDGKLEIKNDQGELIDLLVQLIDAMTKEKHIGNMGAPTQLDPSSLQAYMQIKQKVESFKV